MADEEDLEELQKRASAMEQLARAALFLLSGALLPLEPDEVAIVIRFAGKHVFMVGDGGEAPMLNVPIILRQLADSLEAQNATKLQADGVRTMIH